MPEMTIRPFEGVGPIDFGDSPEQVEQKLGPPDHRRTLPASGREQFFYDRIGRLDFDADGECEYVEARPSSRRPTPPQAYMPVAAGVTVVGRIDDVAATLRSEGFALRPGEDPGDEDNTYYCDELGVVFGPDPDVDPEEIAWVAAWPQGYLEKYATPSGGGAAQ